MSKSKLKAKATIFIVAFAF